MQKVFFILFFTFVVVNCFAQSFEGKITYTNTYKSKFPNLTDEQLTEMMGTSFEYFFKAANYKTQSNGTLMQWQLYNANENKLYSKLSTSDSAIWNDVTVNPDTVFTAEVHLRVKEILGYSCDELILTCKSGVQKYYYSSKLPLDPMLFQKHLLGNWYEYIKVAKAIPLKMIIDSPQFIMESTATAVDPAKLEAKFFLLPEGLKTIKSPY